MLLLCFLLILSSTGGLFLLSGKKMILQNFIGNIFFQRGRFETSFFTTDSYLGTCCRVDLHVYIYCIFEAMTSTKYISCNYTQICAQKKNS